MTCAVRNDPYHGASWWIFLLSSAAWFANVTSVTPPNSFSSRPSRSVRYAASSRIITINWYRSCCRVVRTNRHCISSAACSQIFGRGARRQYTAVAANDPSISSVPITLYGRNPSSLVLSGTQLKFPSPHRLNALRLTYGYLPNPPK